MRLNDATPEDWDRVRNKHPIFNKWSDPAKEEAEENEKAEKALERILLLDASDDEDSVNHPTHYNSGALSVFRPLKQAWSLTHFKGT
jgi:hypothetical protein